jgi:hypothetical protein
LGCGLLECKGEQGQGMEGHEQTLITGPKMVVGRKRERKRNFQKTFFVKKNILEIAR